MKKLIPLLLLLVSMPSLAQRQVDIEVIIFKRAVNAEKTNESWPDTLPQVSFDNTGSLNDANYRANKGVSLLPASSYRLNSQEQRLRNHAGYQVLMHTAWRQGDRGKGSAPIFHIRAGKDYSGQFNPDGSQKGPMDISDQPVYELDGKLQVYVQHYLYAETTLDLKKPVVRKVTVKETDAQDAAVDSDATTQLGNLDAVATTRVEENVLKSYQMDQKRRMRSGETHYLDHPLMGMIIQVRRVN